MTAGPRPTRPLRRCAGLTLLELTLSLIILALVGLGVASMLAMVGASASLARDNRSALQRTHAAQLRISAYANSALALLQEDPARHAFVLWLNDDRPGGRVNLTELRAFILDTTTNELNVEWVVFPAAWSDNKKQKEDKEYGRNEDFLTRIEQKRAQGYTQTATISDGVLAMQVIAPGGKIYDATRFSLSLDVARGDNAPLRSMLTFGLPNHQQPRK